MKKKQVLAMMLTVIIASAQPMAAYAASETKQINVKIDGLLQRMPYLPIIVDGSTMVEAETLFNILGVTRYIITKETGKITFYYQNKIVDMTVGNKIAIVSGNEMGLSVAPLTRDDKIYLPLRYVAERCNATVGWTPETSSISLDTVAADHSVIESVQRTESTENTVTYTLADAVAKVVRESNDFAVLEKEQQDARDALEEEDFERIFENMKDKYWDNPFDLRDMDRTVNALHNTIDQREIEKEQFKKSTEASLIKAMIALEKSEYDIMLLEKKIELDELNIRNMEIKESLGFETTTNIKTAKDNLAQSKLSLSAAKSTLANSKMSLNNSIKVPYDQEVVINYGNNTTPLKIDNLDKYIEDKTAKNHSIQLLEIALRYQGTVRRTHYAIPQGTRETTDGTRLPETTATVEANYKTAEVRVNDAKDALDLSLRQGYSQLQTLEETYASAKIDLDKAVDAYKKTAVAYETGGAVIYDVLTAQMALLNAEAALKKNRLDYVLAKYNIENPGAGAQQSES